MRNRGMTLVELLVAMAILSFLSLFTAQSMRSAFSRKNKINRDVENISAVRDALRIMERDINLAFNYRDFHVELYNLAQDERKKRKNTKKNPAPPENETPEQKTKRLAAEKAQADAEAKAKAENPEEALSEAEKYKKKEEKIVTAFVGKKDSMHFTTLSNIRTSSTQNFSDQSEVGYFLKPCKNRLDKTKTSQCLWRRSTPYLDDEVTEGGKDVAFLENVTKFSIKYKGPPASKLSDSEWIEEWDSTGKYQKYQERQFPNAVEVELEIVASLKGKEKKFSSTLVAGIRFANNSSEEPEEPGSAGSIEDD